MPGKSDIICALVVSAVLAQTPGPSPPQIRSPTVVRVAVDLVQIDATVTDDRGRPVPDLAMSDFQVLQDGRPQPITAFTFVRGSDPTPAGSLGAPRAQPVDPRASPLLPTPDQVRRTIAIVVDDLGLSFESLSRVRRTLQQFVDSKVQAGDLVAILRTSAGIGTLQQFTTDRRMLQAAVERIRWEMRTRVVSFLDPAQPEDPLEALQREYLSAGTLGTVRYVVRGLADLPGRKSLILLSDGFRLTDADRKYGRVLDAQRALVEAANRAAVVIYSIDARGLVAFAPASALQSGVEPIAVVGAQNLDLRETQDGLALLAEETGGLFIRNRNDIAAGLQRVLDDQQGGYYLLGFVPDRSTFTGGKVRFHALSVRATRPGLSVRSRSGFQGVSDVDAKPRTPADRLAASVTSPFAGGGLGLRLTSFFGHDEKGGPVIDSVMHVGARDLTFTEQPDGVRTADIETLAVTFGDNGEMAHQKNWRYRFTLSAAAYASALDRGFVYRLRVPVKRPGPYQLRVALRDVASDRIGSAHQFVQVPDVKNGRLALSGLIVEGLSAGGAGEVTDPSSTIAVRRFRQGTDTRYLCTVFNARRKKNQTDLVTELRLYRDGIEVLRQPTGSVVPVAGTDDVLAGGVLHLGPLISPGAYVLEVAVIDRLATRANRATQTIDFDVVEHAPVSSVK